VNTKHSIAFEKKKKVKEGLGKFDENCVNDKSKNEIKLKPSGHQVIKSENGELKRI
jgi:hypothetical protein